MSELPTNWETTPLSRLCERIVDGSHNPPKAAAEGYPMLSARNIQDRKINFGDYRLISEGDFQIEHKRTSIRSGDVLMTIVGTIGRTAVVCDDIKPFALQRSVAVLRAQKIDSQYLSYALEAPLIQKLLADNAKGTAQKGVYLKTLGTIEIPLAPLPEQKRIADKLDTVLARVDACLDRLDRLPALLKRLRQSILAAATSGLLTEDWRKGCAFTVSAHRFEDIVEESVTGLVRATNEQFSEGEELVPYVKMNNLNGDWGCNESGLVRVRCTSTEYERYALRVGDWLFNTRNSVELVGKSCVWNGAPYVFNNNLLRVRFKASVSPSYIEIWFRSPNGRDILSTVKSATTSVAAIYQRSLMALTLELPSLEEQHEIVRRIDMLFDFADRLESRLATARKQVDQLTPALLAKAFRGELVPQDPADEPASELLKRLAAAGKDSPPKARRGKVRAGV